jgi:predicted SPOUT superfamily RNA methylase MTH1
VSIIFMELRIGNFTAENSDKSQSYREGVFINI